MKAKKTFLAKKASYLKFVTFSNSTFPVKYIQILT